MSSRAKLNETLKLQWSECKSNLFKKAWRKCQMLSAEQQVALLEEVRVQAAARVEQLLDHVLLIGIYRVVATIATLGVHNSYNDRRLG